MRTARTRLLVVLGAAALLLGASACIPIPPGTFDADQFPPEHGPNIVRAEVFQGLGAWWDVWDWSPTFTGGQQAKGLSAVDRLAWLGVQTLYVQTATYRRPEDLLDPAVLHAIIARAHLRGMRVVGWYLPEFVDEALDLRRMSGGIDLGFDGFAIDIESRRNPDEAARSAALLREVQAVRAAHPRLPLAAVPVAPIVWAQLSETWWPNFPYRDLAPYFDAWMPQAYWTYRTPESGLRDAYRYTRDNVTLLRERTGVAWLPVHPIGGEAVDVTNDDLAGMYRAFVETHSIGGSIYDDASTSNSLWGRLRWFRIPK